MGKHVTDKPLQLESYAYEQRLRFHLQNAFGNFGPSVMAGQYPGHYGNNRQHPPQMFTPGHSLSRSGVNTSSPDLYHPMSGPAGSSSIPYQTYLPANVGRAGHVNITEYQNMAGQLPVAQTTAVKNTVAPLISDSEEALARRYALKPPRHAPLHKTRDLGKHHRGSTSPS